MLHYNQRMVREEALQQWRINGETGGPSDEDFTSSEESDASVEPEPSANSVSPSSIAGTAIGAAAAISAEYTTAKPKRKKKKGSKKKWSKFAISKPSGNTGAAVSAAGNRASESAYAGGVGPLSIEATPLQVNASVRESGRCVAGPW